MKNTIRDQFAAVWNERFKSFVKWKPGRLLRRHGPLLVGLAIEPATSERTYQIVFHTHNLTTPWDKGEIVFGLAGSLVGRSGLSEEVSRNLKEMEERNVFQRFIETYPPVDSNRLTFNDYVGLTRNYLAGKHGSPVVFDILPYRELLVIAAWCGYREYVLAQLDRFLRETADWRDNLFQFVGGRQKLQADIRNLADNPRSLDAIVESEVEKHGLQKIPDYGLEIDAVPEKL